MTSTLRADARRNLDRILEAAAEVFAELGPDAPIDEVARRAGVGHGTVFRRFPTKEALRAAVLARRLDEIQAYVEELLARDEVEGAFEDLVLYSADSCRRDRAFFEGIERCAPEFSDVMQRKEHLHDTVNKLIRRARKAGLVRREFDARDLGALVGAAIEASQHAERPDAWKRYVRILLDGLKP